jgi:hypothetical protein
MPTADYTPPSALPDFLRQFAEPAPADLVAEVAALRLSIDKLVAELRPVPPSSPPAATCWSNTNN